MQECFACLSATAVSASVTPCLGFLMPHVHVKVGLRKWAGSRGDVRLLARLGLSQASLQDEKDAQQKMLAAKSRWRRKSSSAGMCV